MPEMDGYQATRMIRQYELSNAEDKSVPIIALTANAASEDKALCEEAGMNDIVTKPFNKSDLYQTVRKWM